MGVSAKFFLMLAIASGLGYGGAALATNVAQIVAGNSGQSQYTLAQFSSQEVASRDNDSDDGQPDRDHDDDKYEDDNDD